MKKKSTIEARSYTNPNPAGICIFLAIVPADATGQVWWYVDQAYVTSNGLAGSNGLVTLNYMNITPVGDHLIMAVYPGDTNYLPSSTVIIQTAT